MEFSKVARMIFQEIKCESKYMYADRYAIFLSVVVNIMCSGAEVSIMLWGRLVLLVI